MRADFSGVILAGGRSSRMGHPKAFLPLKGRRMIDIILEVFYSLFDEILIVTDDTTKFVDFRGVEVIQDLVKGCGPLGGIYTGLKAISREKAFLVACDMPFLHSELIERLLLASVENKYDCVVPSSFKGSEPLHAVYSTRILPIIEDLLRGKDLSLNQLLKRCHCKYVKVENKDISSFVNVNTPEQLQKVS